MLIITSKHEGFRRCGVAHPAAPTEYPDDAFTPEQIAILQAEPMLTIVTSADTGLADKPASAAEMMARIKQAASFEELASLADGETRKTVCQAIEARYKELGG